MNTPHPSLGHRLRQRGAALLAAMLTVTLVAIGAQRVAVFGVGPRVRQGQVDDQGAHGEISRAIVGCGFDGAQGALAPSGLCRGRPSACALAPRSRQKVVTVWFWRRTQERSCTVVSPRRRRPRTSK